ncbi:MAG: 6,7-dimethyl-8-ribityllumazine synthase [Verrucomicrobiota bacterium]
MSNITPHRPRNAYSARHSFAIVASQYNPEYVKGLIDAVQREIEALSPKSVITLVEVPGAFEIPVVLQEVAAKGGVDAIIALGVIIKGQTAHADLIGSTITDALQNIALRFRTPVIHEVLLVDNIEQARSRTLGTTQNRGIEAARAALQVAEVMGALKLSVKAN